MKKKICFLGEYTAGFFETLYGSIDPEIFDQVPLNKADYVFYSTFTPDHYLASSNAVKILIPGENICPDFNACDYAISNEYLNYGDRHLRVPFYVLVEDIKSLANRPLIAIEDLIKRKNFCNFIYSNNALAHPIREQFFHALNNHVPVVSAGHLLKNNNSLSNQNDDTDWRVSKMAFMKKFRFTIAMENSEHPGYTCEKIADALYAHTIPIYWGDPRIMEEFNPAAFVHLRDYKDLSEAVSAIINLNGDTNRMLKILNAPVFSGNIDQIQKYKNLATDFLNAIFAQPLATAQRRPRHGNSLWLEQKRRKNQTGVMRKLNVNRF